MLDFAYLTNPDPYSLKSAEKERFLFGYLTKLLEHHAEHCPCYKKILKAWGYDRGSAAKVSDLPFLPVSLFKNHELCSVPASEIVKTITSSGTTGQKTSKIFLDKTTAINQQKALVKIVSSCFENPKGRFPMLIIDAPDVIANRARFSARGAGVLGFSLLGREKVFALNPDLSLNLGAIEDFLSRHGGEEILIFGFTYVIWQHFYEALLKLRVKLDLSLGVLFHGGGWKRLVNRKITAREYKDALYEQFALEKIHDYYGMAEQAGSIYVQCRLGHLHCSDYSDLIVRRPRDFVPCHIGQSGIAQVVSVLPVSYPGFSLLTDDEAVILGEDDCPCGRLGKYFKIKGRLPDAELRGCSDVYGL